MRNSFTPGIGMERTPVFAVLEIIIHSGGASNRSSVEEIGGILPDEYLEDFFKALGAVRGVPTVEIKAHQPAALDLKKMTDQMQAPGGEPEELREDGWTLQLPAFQSDCESTAWWTLPNLQGPYKRPKSLGSDRVRSEQSMIGSMAA